MEQNGGGKENGNRKKTS